MAKGKEALIFYGGWAGHEPEAGAQIVASMLRRNGFAVLRENSTEVLADPQIHDLSLIVPIFTMSTIEKEELDNLCRAVRGGVGLGGYHGGMCDAFRNATEYQFMCGGQWVAHPGDIIDYRVDVAEPGDPVMAGSSSAPWAMSPTSSRCRRCAPSSSAACSGRREPERRRSPQRQRLPTPETGRIAAPQGSVTNLETDDGPRGRRKGR